jgi:hypothetical protein
MDDSVELTFWVKESLDYDDWDAIKDWDVHVREVIAEEEILALASVAAQNRGKTEKGWRTTGSH